MNEDELDEELWGPMPTALEIEHAEAMNEAMLALRKAVFVLLGPGMSQEGKEAWLGAPCVFLAGRDPWDVLIVGLYEVRAAVEQMNAGDFA